MSAQIIDGKSAAQNIRSTLTQQIIDESLTPGLAVILVGDDPASNVYVRRKLKACEKVGIASFEYRLDAGVSQEEVLDLIAQLNADDKVHGILLQLPLPEHIDAPTCLEAIDPVKDVDGLHSQNMGRLMGRQKGIVSCTPQACLHLIKSVKEDLTGLHALVIGTSRLMGRPMGLLLLQEDCTVTYAHVKTRNTKELCKAADIVIVATGVPHLVKGDWIKDGAIVIDVGINRKDDGTLTGDVNFEAAKERAGAITPVPGGVGPMTIACLLKNTVEAAQRAQKGA